MVTYFCYVLMLLASVSVFAEEPPLPKTNPAPPPGLSINGGISLLFIVGAAYGSYAIKKIKRLKVL